MLIPWQFSVVFLLGYIAVVGLGLTLFDVIQSWYHGLQGRGIKSEAYMFPDNSHPLSGIEAELASFETTLEYFSSWCLQIFETKMWKLLGLQRNWWLLPLENLMGTQHSVQLLRCLASFMFRVLIQWIRDRVWRWTKVGKVLYSSQKFHMSLSLWRSPVSATWH